MRWRNRIESDMDDELRFHIEQRAAHLERSGVPREQALRQARLEFGAMDKYKEECRESLGLRWIDEVSGDVRYALRQIRRSPAFSVVAVMTLAIAIGANTATFSLVNAVMLKILPVHEPEQLRLVEWWRKGPRSPASNYSGTFTSTEAGSGASGSSFSYPAFLRFQREAHSFEEIFASAPSPIRVSLSVDNGFAALARVLMVSANYFKGLGTGAVVARVLVPEDDSESTRQPVAALSHAFWKARFGSDPRVIGTALRVNGTACTIVGVTAEGFRGIDPAQQPDIFVPLWMQPQVMVWQSQLADRTNWWVRIMGRLKPGVSDAQARQELDTILRAEVAESAAGKEYDMPEVRLPPGGQGLDILRKTMGQPLRILLGIVAVVLLIACTNLASLMLARSAARMGEMGTRLALGAARSRLIRQMLTETLLLAAIGGVAGVGIAFALRGTLPGLLVRWSAATALDLSIDWRLLAFCAAVCTLTGLLAGILPSLRATRVDLGPMLQLSGQRGAASPRLRAGKALVTAQVGLSTVLLVGAALFVRTVWNLQSVRLGVDAEHVLTFQVNTRQVGYDPPRTKNFLEQSVARLAALPGVTSASVSGCGILTDCMSATTVQPPGADRGSHGGISIHTNRIAPAYFRTMGIPLLAGRDFTSRDRDGGPTVVLLNQTAVRRLFGERSPLGQRLGDREVIGVVADAKYDRLREDPPPTMYEPIAQNKFARGGAVLVRAAGDPAKLGNAMRQAIASIDSKIPVFEMRTQLEIRNRAISQERLFAALLTGFSALALLLAGIGIYGTLAYAVARRRGEIGIRMALGAGRPSVQRLVVRESLIAVLAGLAIGLGTAAALSRVIESMLYGVQRTDPLAFSGAAAVLLAGATVAAWLPAWRASRVDPMLALRV